MVIVIGYKNRKEKNFERGDFREESIVFRREEIVLKGGFSLSFQEKRVTFFSTTSKLKSIKISQEYSKGDFFCFLFCYSVSISTEIRGIERTRDLPELYHVHTVEGSCPIRRSQILGGGCRPE